MSKPSSGWDKTTKLVRLESLSRGLTIIDAISINCNKRFKSMRAVSMHLRMTATRHAVNFINYGIHDKKTGLRESNRAELISTCQIIN